MNHDYQRRNTKKHFFSIISIKSLPIFKTLVILSLLTSTSIAGGLTAWAGSGIKSEGNFFTLDSVLYCDAIVVKFSKPVISITGPKRIYDIDDISKTYEDVIDAFKDLDDVFTIDEIVKMIPGITAADTTAIHKITGETVSLVNNSQLFIAKFIDPVPVDSVCGELEDIGDVAYAHVPVSMVQFEQPNDPEFTDGSNNVRWYYDVINIVDAWDITHGSTNKSIAMVDYGACSNHEDISGKVLSISTTDGDDHANRCASIAAATCDNSIGLSGIGWNTKLKLYGMDADNLLFTIGRIVGAYRYSDVVNFSIGFARPIQIEGELVDIPGSCPQGSRDSWGARGIIQHDFPEIRDEIENAIALGTVVVAAAGNYSKNEFNQLPNLSLCDPDQVPFVSYPASYEDVIAVTATTINQQSVEDFKEGYTYGDFVDISAPGTGFTLASGDDNCNSTDEYDDEFSGTSYSSPMVAGLASLILAMEPYADVLDVLSSTSDQVGSYQYDGNGWNNRLGFGRIDALGALESLIPQTPTNFSVSGSSGAHPVLTWSANSEDDLDYYQIYRSLDGGAYQSFLTVDAPTTTCTDTEVTCSSGRFDPTVCYKISAVDEAGNESDPTTHRCKRFDQIEKPIPGEDHGIYDELDFALNNVYPNPFNGSIMINIEIPTETSGLLYISDVLGHKVKSFSGPEGGSFKKGRHSVIWKAEDNSGKTVPSGLYFIHLQSESEHLSQKILLTK